MFERGKRIRTCFFEKILKKKSKKYKNRKRNKKRSFLMNIIPYSRQKIDRTDINEVVKVLKSNFLTQGEEVPKFEKKVRAKVRAKFS